MSGSILDHPVIAQRYFFPRRAPLDPSGENALVVRVEGCELHCHLHAAAEADAPLLVHFHGNGEVVADWIGDWPQRLAALGISTLFAEYRGYGGSSGVPALSSMLADAVAIVEAAGAPPTRIVAYGRSVGSIFALHAAHALGLAGLILESGIADVGERLLLRMDPRELGVSEAELDEALTQEVDHRAKLGELDKPVLVFHAEGDDLVPIDHGERLAAWSSDGALRRFERGDHNTIHAYNGDVIIEETAAFVARVTS